MSLEEIEKPKRPRGVFIVADGCDGAGKTTQLKLISQFLNKVGISHITTREPGGTDIAEDIRSCLFKNKNMDEPMHPMTELLLVNAARYQHIHNKIIPSLENGDWVLCDRFNDSTWSYQGYAGGASLAHISDIEDVVLDGFKPDYVFMFDIDPNVAASRMSGRGDENAFDLESIEFKQNLREGFAKRSDRNTKTVYIKIPADNPIETITESLEIWMQMIIGGWSVPEVHTLYDDKSLKDRMYDSLGVPEEHRQIMDDVDFSKAVGPLTNNGKSI